MARYPESGYDTQPNIQTECIVMKVQVLLSCCVTVGILAGCAQTIRPTQEEIARAQRMPIPSRPYEAATAWLQENLKDRESAQYRGFRAPASGVLVLPILNSRGGQDFEHYGNTRTAGWFVCGEVNAKNSYGGYTGYQPFMVHFSPNDPAIVDDGWIGDEVGSWCLGLYGY